MNLPDELGWERHLQKVRANAKTQTHKTNMSFLSPLLTVPSRPWNEAPFQRGQLTAPSGLFTSTK